MTTTQPTVDQFTADDMYRIEDLADRLAGALTDNEITVRIIGPADLDACTECSAPDAAERIAGDVVVHYGHARPIYTAHVCASCLRRFLAIRARHDQARPVVDIPAAVLS